jgi:hypothetical protein
MRPHVNVFVADTNMRDLDGSATALADGAELTVLPAVSGGAVSGRERDAASVGSAGDG